MDRIEDALDAACEGQRDALRRYRLSGDPADAARVHYESCPACLAAIDAIAAGRLPDAAALPHVEGNRPWVIALYVGSRLLPVAAIAALVFFCASGFVGRELSPAIDRLQERVLYVRMPGRPDVCVAALHGAGGYGPTFLGAAPCAAVRDRVAFDEDVSWRLGRMGVVRVRGTDQCLAQDGERSFFTLPCGRDD